MKIYTLGTGMRESATFMKIIKEFNIDTIVDVRRFPTSKNEYFKIENLSLICLKESINYIHLGNELGGYRRGGYEAYTKTEAFNSGIEKLIKIAKNRNTCVICAETLPWKCHRRFIAKRLIEMGYEVIHIIDEKHIWQQPQNVARVSNPDNKKLNYD